MTNWEKYGEHFLEVIFANYGKEMAKENTITGYYLEKAFNISKFKISYPDSNAKIFFDWFNKEYDILDELKNGDLLYLDKIYYGRLIGTVGNSFLVDRRNSSIFEEGPLTPDVEVLTLEQARKKGFSNKETGI